VEVRYDKDGSVHARKKKGSETDKTKAMQPSTLTPKHIQVAIAFAVAAVEKDLPVAERPHLR
jgi:hypothetical protein